MSMIKWIITVIIVFNLHLLCAQRNFTIPPGTLSINDSLYMDKSPVTNRMFVEYLTGKKVLNKKGYSSFKKYIEENSIKDFPPEFKPAPLSLILIDHYANQNYLKKKGYGWDPMFNHHPVLNVSRDQAEDYCKWRSEMVHYRWSTDPRFTSKKTHYRLATAQELTLAYDYFVKEKDIDVLKGKLLKIKPPNNATNFTMFPIKEMTASEKVFNDIPSYEFTGFRCICELK